MQVSPQLGAENPPAGEQGHIDSLIRRLRAKMERDYAGGRILRDAHPKMHGCLRGEFTIEPNLPAELAIGLFKDPHTYPVWVRLSNQNGTVAPDTKGDIRGLAMKVMGVPGKKLLPDYVEGTNQDFILISENRFVTRDVAEFDGLVTALTTGPIQIIWFFLTHPRAARNLLVSLRKCGDLLALRYFSVAPYRLGTRAVKYCLTPRNAGAPDASGTSDNFLRERLVARLSKEAAVFDFAIQFQTDPVGMPVEDPGIAWDETTSPFRKVATLTLPSQVFDTEKQREFGDNLSFNPWRTLEEHRPLSGISRARLQVYQALSRFRHERNQSPSAEPTGTE